MLYCFLLGNSPASEFCMPHRTISFPLHGIADSRYVITGAPQNDICPHGRTNLMNVVCMDKNRITVPTDHVCTMFYDS